MDDNMLRHHGILGQKWGVRRTAAQLERGGRSSSKKATSDDSHEDYKRAHSGKSTKSMSDSELRSKLNRLQMERQYSQLSKTDVNRGKKYLDSVIKAETTVATVTSTALTIYNNIDKIKGIVNKVNS